MKNLVIEILTEQIFTKNNRPKEEIFVTSHKEINGYFYSHFQTKNLKGLLMQTTDNECLLTTDDGEISVINLKNNKKTVSTENSTDKKLVNEIVVDLPSGGTAVVKEPNTDEINNYSIHYELDGNLIIQNLSKKISDYNNGILLSLISSFIKKNGFDIKEKNYKSLKVISNNLPVSVKEKIEK